MTELGVEVPQVPQLFPEAEQNPADAQPLNF